MSEGVWQHVVDPGGDWVNEIPHTCEASPSVTADMPHGSTWACACGRSNRLNRRGTEATWVTGGLLNTQQVQEQVYPPPHTCQPPELNAADPIGNGSSWLCGCGKTYRVNRRGEHLSWVNAN